MSEFDFTVKRRYLIFWRAVCLSGDRVLWVGPTRFYQDMALEDALDTAVNMSYLSDSDDA